MTESPTPTFGVVKEWSQEEGWGLLTSPELNGNVFAHYSLIVDQDDFRELQVGQAVAFTWSAPGQDGYEFQAEKIYSNPDRLTRSRSESSQVSETSAYQSSLKIKWD